MSLYYHALQSGERVEDRHAAGFEAFAAVVSVGDQCALHAHRVGDFKVVDGVADKQYFVRWNVELCDVLLSVSDFSGGVDVVESDDVAEKPGQLEIIGGFQQGLLLVGGEHRLLEFQPLEEFNQLPCFRMQGALKASLFVFGNEFLGEAGVGVGGVVEVKLAVVIGDGEAEFVAVGFDRDRRQVALYQHVVIDFHAKPRVVPQRPVPVPDDVFKFHELCITVKSASYTETTSGSFV